MKTCSSRMKIDTKLRTANRLVPEYVKTDGWLSSIDTLTNNQEEI